MGCQGNLELEKLSPRVFFGLKNHCKTTFEVIHVWGFFVLFIKKKKSFSLKLLSVLYYELSLKEERVQTKMEYLS